MAHEYYLRVNRITQSDAADSVETVTAPDKINAGRFFHLYVTGYLPPGASGIVGTYRPVSGGAGADIDLGNANSSPDGYKFTITHYVLAAAGSYLLRFADDFSAPHCLGSQVVDTLP